MEKSEEEKQAKPEQQSNKAAIAAAGFFNFVGRLISKTSKFIWKFSRRYWRQLLIGAVVILLVVFIVGYFNTKNELNKTNQAKSATQDAKSLSARLGKEIALPNEAPVLGHVTDITKLKGQAFFKEAQDGDVVLIYQKAGKAVLYRPSTDRIILYMYASATTGQNSGQQPAQQ